ncbi:MAG TPA: hypothetical protein VFA55_03950 [Candidatus Kapabacteria bacterium]|nr:hypothetical protein [Candidatus Kapabacteria bacterium]
MANLLRWGARIIGVGFAAFFLFFLVIEGTGYLNYLAVGDILLVVFLFASVVGGLLAWWLERPGAYIMIAFALLFGALNAAQNGNYYGFVIMLPMMIAGAMHLAATYIKVHTAQKA